jgi:hypothetical protein
MTKIKKLPPGRALGSDDLRWWAMRRGVGRSGAPMTRKEWKQWRKPRKLDAADEWLAENDKGKRR